MHSHVYVVKNILCSSLIMQVERNLSVSQEHQFSIWQKTLF